MKRQRSFCPDTAPPLPLMVIRRVLLLFLGLSSAQSFVNALSTSKMSARFVRRRRQSFTARQHGFGAYYAQPVFTTQPSASRHTLTYHSAVPINGDDKSDSASGKEEQPYPQLGIAFVTGNQMKVNEMNMILADHGATKGPTPATSLVNLRILNVDLPEIQEVNTMAIASEKARLGAQLANGPCVVEDTSLMFHALGGMPGPYIKWFQDKLGSEGLYKILHAYEDKSATAVCTLAFCPYPHADPVLFTGQTLGRIVKPQPGRGFGWDGIFVPDDSDVPFSCMTTAQKNQLSHRGKALKQWADWLGANQKELFERQLGRPAIGHQGLDFKTKNQSNTISLDP